MGEREGGDVLVGRSCADIVKCVFPSSLSFLLLLLSDFYFYVKQLLLIAFLLFIFTIYIYYFFVYDIITTHYLMPPIRYRHRDSSDS